MKKYGFSYKFSRQGYSGSLYDFVYTKRYKTVQGLVDGLKWIEKNPDYIVVKIIK